MQYLQKFKLTNWIEKISFNQLNFRITQDYDINSIISVFFFFLKVNYKWIDKIVI